MAELSWAEQTTERFFENHNIHSQMLCDEIARSISNALTIRPVDTPGSTSYTVICNGCPNPLQDLVLSFREQEALISEYIVKLAQSIHGDIVPMATCHGDVEGAYPPLHIYSMPFLRGSSWIQVSPCQPELEADAEAKHKVFIKHLARYFARCWRNPQPVNSQNLAEGQEEVRKRLVQLAESSLSMLPNLNLPELINMLPSLFSPEYPQVLTHNDFSVTNILVDESTFEITGIVDWSLAALKPFGLDIDILFLTTGYMTLTGWHDYASKQLLLDTFWKEFWAVSGVQEQGSRRRIQSLAEVAGRIGAILRSAFRRNADGSPSAEVLVSESSMSQMNAWFGK